MNTISATTARENLYQLIEEVALSGKRVGITNKGETKAILISPEELSSWESTIEVMSDHKLVKGIEKSLSDIKKGQIVPWAQVKKKAKL